MMSILEIGCCGAYCRTCRAFRGGACRGCNTGYDNGQRKLERARCRIKLCCLGKKRLQTCADCEEFDSCAILRNWYAKKGAKYQRYKRSAEYIRSYGYDPSWPRPTVGRTLAASLNENIVKKEQK